MSTPQILHRVTIFTSESARWNGKHPTTFVLELLRKSESNARCLAWHGQAGYYENGEAVSNHIELASADLPVKIEILGSPETLARVLPQLKDAADDAIITSDALQVCLRRSKRIPKFSPLTVAELMSKQPVSASPVESATAIARRLLQAAFHALPVVDKQQRVIGIITQGDLMNRAQMPVRLGLLRLLQTDAEPGWNNHAAATDVMTSPAVTTSPEQSLPEAVSLMLRKNLKRLPVTNEQGQLVGMLSRCDILRAAAEQPDRVLPATIMTISEPSTFPCTPQSPAKTVREAARITVPSVLPDATFAEVLCAVDRHHMQRVVVVDADNRFLGMIFDHDLIAAFGQDHTSILHCFAQKLWRAQDASRNLSAKTAQELMRTDIATVRPGTPLEEVLKQMATTGYKRMPVLDGDGRFLGLISRDSLLRATCF